MSRFVTGNCFQVEIMCMIFNFVQAPDKFVAAATRNPVCNLALMVGTTDIPDWCYVEAYGSKGKNSFTASPSVEDLALFHSKSPISHVSKVCHQPGTDFGS